MLKFRAVCPSCVLVIGISSIAGADVSPIRFKNGTLTIQAETPRDVVAKITAAAGRSAGSSHFILQFDQPITPQDRTKLMEAGVELLGYLGDNGFFASAQATRLNGASLEAMGGLTRFAEITPDQRMHPDLLAGQIPEWAMSVKQPEPGKVDSTLPAEEPTIALNIKFHADVSLDHRAIGLIQQLSGTVRAKLWTVNGLVVELPQGMLNILAGMDEIEWIEPPLPFMTEVNAENRALTGVNTLQQAPYNLNGAGVSAMVYDGGRVFTTHSDLTGRSIVGNGELACTPVSNHSTHVAGTIAGNGAGNINNRGMAPAASIVSYGLNQSGGCSLSQGFLYTDPGDMQSDYNTAVNTHGADIANNSIGTNTEPNGFPCAWQGDYSVTDTVIDSMVRGSLGAPFRIVWANGNERQGNRCDIEGFGDYYSTAPPATAKNHITCGATNANDDSMTTFSSWGPVDDGRMKPDISAPGCQNGGDGGVTSCSSSGGYTSLCGTSMACPTVTGISSLILQDYRARFPARPDFRNSTLKILLAHTAVDRGNPGPDNQFGYGSVRGPAAVDFMRSNDYANFVEASVDQGGSYNVLVLVSASDPVMKVTLAWDDPPGTPNVNPALVNDLDLVVFDPNNNQRFPWTLDPANPSANAAQTQRNSRDNIEQVLVNAPAAGVYRIEVRGLSVPQGPQPFSLCASPQLINCSRQGVIALDRSKYPCSSTASITVVDCDLNTDDGVVETVNVSIASNSEPGGETVTLTETGPLTALFQGTISLSTSNSAGVLQIAHGDTVTATYIDADDGQGGINVTVTSTATVDCQPPIISNVQATNIQPNSATITFATDEPSRGTVRHGTSCGSLSNTVQEGGFVTSHSIVIDGLSPNNTYFFAVDAVDQAGNSVIDDNGGACYSFMTPDIPELFTEQFSTDDLDLSNKSITFIPDAGISHYTACTTSISAFPTDPVGGTTISSWTSCNNPGDDCYFTLTLSGGATVKLHGVSYSTMFVGSNGYITFSSGDRDYDETLAKHFSQPRVSAFYDDLGVSPCTCGSGSVSYKQLADRLAVSWLNVQHFSQPTQQESFQIEMFFDGRIRLNYLTLTNTINGLIAGLSAGGGLSPDFFESDLSEESAGCGPQPPTANNSSVSTPRNTGVNITLVASDPNNDPLDYILTTLPTKGKLRDPGAGIITAVPYTLVGGGNVVRYIPNVGISCLDGFQFKVNDGGTPPTGGDSNTATVALSIVGILGTFYNVPMDSDPGWTTQGQWAYGAPGGVCGDPLTGSGGAPNVYGYNLAGCYPNNMAATEYLTTTPFNCSCLMGVQLRFRRWLGVEGSASDRATIDVSNNGTTWTNVFSNATTSLQESSWSLQTYDISAVADGQPTVFVRWGMGTTNGTTALSGWNVDDVEIRANYLASTCSFLVRADMNFDTKVDGADIQKFVSVLVNPGSATPQEICAADCYTDSAVNLLDADEFVTLLLNITVP